MDVRPLTLTGRIVRLEPLSEEHVPDLTIAGRDESIWRYLPWRQPRTEAQMLEWVREVLQRQAQGNELPFAVFHLEAGRVVGTTRFQEMRPHYRSVEIGGTWYAVEYQRTGVNTECKYLMLCQAFDVWNCVRVQFKTDVRNARSRRALERIGAVPEGVMRNHMIMPDGYIRHSVYYSIIASEWPAVKELLEKKLEG